MATGVYCKFHCFRISPDRRHLPRIDHDRPSELQMHFPLLHDSRCSEIYTWKKQEDADQHEKIQVTLKHPRSSKYNDMFQWDYLKIHCPSSQVIIWIKALYSKVNYFPWSLFSKQAYFTWFNHIVWWTDATNMTESIVDTTDWFTE